MTSPQTVFGTQLCGELDAAAAREWLVTDGLGGFAMGTVAGLRTRRYHGLLVAATKPPIGRQLALVALDATLVVGDTRQELATHEWASGVVGPSGHQFLSSFDLSEGVPRWRWTIGDIVLECELAMVHGRNAVGVVHRLLRGPANVRLELAALSTWRDVHGERFADGDAHLEVRADGYEFEHAYRVQGIGFEPVGEWWHGSFHREEAQRGLNASEDVFCAGRFVADLAPGDAVGVVAWSGDLETPPGPADQIVAAARTRAGALGARVGGSALRRRLAVAADQFVVAGPSIVAGYPWFGEWSRDSFTSYEGLFLATSRAEEGRDMLIRAAGTVSEGMLANTSDVGETAEYNTVDGTLWFLHALARHVEVTGDTDLLAQLAPTVDTIVAAHIAGTRYGIGVDPTDGLLRQGQDGVALTWMDARVDGVPVTPRVGKPVEVNALWISALGRLEQLMATPPSWAGTSARAAASFRQRFVLGPNGLPDVVDGPFGDDLSLRPNQLLAAALPGLPLSPEQAGAVVDAVAPLLTPLGLRSLDPTDHHYLGRHRGSGAERDRAYHQGTIWPWLIGPYVDAAIRAGRTTAGVLDGLSAHLNDWGLGSVSETADGDAPHAATGCPFQAWSVAEMLRVTE